MLSLGGVRRARHHGSVVLVNEVHPHRQMLRHRRDAGVPRPDVEHDHLVGLEVQHRVVPHRQVTKGGVGGERRHALGAFRLPLTGSRDVAASRVAHGQAGLRHGAEGVHVKRERVALRVVGHGILGHSRRLAVASVPSKGGSRRSMLADGQLDRRSVGVRKGGRVVDVDQLHGEVGREALGGGPSIPASVGGRVLHDERRGGLEVKVHRSGADHSLLGAWVVRHGELVVARTAGHDAERDRIVGPRGNGVLVHEGEAGNDHAGVAVLLDKQDGRRGRLGRSVVAVLDGKRHSCGARQRRHAVVRCAHT
mmetsp:Transcript_15287/g.57780  ORF Transcript_15287/g.57780 Transcript_15287/m.57780 type:complete len:308 (+) Transcript_15287:1497-2420(+)